MINIGENIEEVYVSSTKIAQAYVGNQLVYEAGEEDIYTYLRKQGCIAWFPLAYEGDFTDVIGGLTLTSVIDSRMTWDTDKGMYLVNCVAQRPAATIDLASSIFTDGGTYGVMAQVELESGSSDVVTVAYSNVAAGNGGLTPSNTLSWDATFIVYSNIVRYAYHDDEVTANGNSTAFTRSFASVGLGRNRRYAANGNVYVRDLLFFNKLVPFTTYQKIKAKLEDLRNS